MIGAAIGLLVTAGFAFLVEFLDDTLKTPDEIKEVLELPVIGFVAEIRNGESKKGESLGKFVARHPRSPVSEAFRSLRTNLEFSGVDKPLKVVLVTSSGESEGKSTIAANLAIVVAQSGKQVLILDADMRRPTMHTQFEKTNRVGLSDLLTHKLAAEDVIKPLERIPNLHMITCGKRPPNPSELLGSERMAQLINVFRDSYDFVIIDCPPLLVSDAQILSTKVDGTIMVVQHGHTRAIAALRPLEELRRIGAKVVGVVMNRIPRNRDYYYGGYYYYSPYVSQTEEGQGGETVRHKRSSSSRRRGWFGRSASTEKPVDELSEVEQGQESS
jgi:capsular exopolysaccharide synthesis family protein